MNSLSLLGIVGEYQRDNACESLMTSPKDTIRTQNIGVSHERYSLKLSSQIVNTGRALFWCGQGCGLHPKHHKNSNERLEI